jgi:hypothetical protein
MKQKFITLLKETGREGIENLIAFLEKSDFFTAPCSTRFHGAYEGGLLEHSLNVYACLQDITNIQPINHTNFNSDSLIISALLHDLCKTNFYKVSFRNAKDANGVWQQVPFYEVEDTHPYGHGECSVMMAEQFIKLTIEERYAIRWHMGGFDDSVKGGSYALSGTFEKYPLALALHMADMTATYILEKR